MGSLVLGGHVTVKDEHGNSFRVVLCEVFDKSTQSTSTLWIQGNTESTLRLAVGVALVPVGALVTFTVRRRFGLRHLV